MPSVPVGAVGGVAQLLGIGLGGILEYNGGYLPTVGSRHVGW